jgi:hypothetical protein
VWSPRRGRRMESGASNQMLTEEQSPGGAATLSLPPAGLSGLSQIMSLLCSRIFNGSHFIQSRSHGPRSGPQGSLHTWA